MEEITIDLYSEKGLAVKGATKEQANEIALYLGKNVPLTFSESHGYVFSRKHEKDIQAIIETMNGE